MNNDEYSQKIHRIIQSTKFNSAGNATFGDWTYNKYRCTATNNITGKRYNWGFEEFLIERCIVQI